MVIDKKLAHHGAIRVWFTRNSAVYDPVGNKSYIGILLVIGNDGYRSGLVEYDHATGQFDRVALRTTVEFDDHGESSVLVRADGTLVVAYSNHNDLLLRFRVSANPRDIHSFGSEITVDPSNPANSYLSLFEASNGDIYCFHRDRSTASNSNWSWYKSTDGGNTWGSKVRFVNPGNGLSQQGYFIPAQDPNNKDIIHCVMTRHQPTQLTTAFNTVHHFWIDLSTEKFYQSDGTEITATKPFGRSDTTLILNDLGIGANDTAWIEDIAVDENGNPRVLICYYEDGLNNNYQTKDLVYMEWTGSAWTTPYFIHRENDGYISVDEPPRMPCSTFLAGNPDIIIGCKNVGGTYEVHKITRLAHNNFTVEQETFDSMYHQWRPVTTKAPEMNVWWLNSIYYALYTNYDSQLVGGTID